jgi:hypothetical protein
MRRLFLGGLFLITAGYALDALPFRTYRNYDFWYTSPNYFWMKFGTLAVMMSSLWFLETHSWWHGFSMPRWVTILGIESLFVYIVHLIILYGWAGNPDLNLSAWWAMRLSTFEVLVVFGGLTAAMWLAAKGWHYLKREHSVLWRGILWWMGITVSIHFLTSPY